MLNLIKGQEHSHLANEKQLPQNEKFGILTPLKWLLYIIHLKFNFS